MMPSGRVAVRALGVGCLLGCLCVLPVWAAKAERSRWPSAREYGTYQAKMASTGQVLWWVNWETHTVEAAGGKRVEILEEGKGQPWKYREPITWEKRMVFLAPVGSQGQEEKVASPVFVESVRGKRWTQKGKFVSELEIERDAAGKQMVYRDSLPGRSRESAAMKWTPQIVPDELLFHWARTIPFEESGEAQCLLWVSPKRQFWVKAKVRGTETVTTPAGTFPCYRVELRPELFGPLEAFAPRLALWCTVQPPHHWVRYQGPVGGPGSPEAVIELVEFRQE